MRYRFGFTMVEVLIIMGILAVLFSITSLNLSNTVPKNSLDDAVSLLVANLKSQQLSAMTGYTEAQTTNSNYGIYFTQGRYVLFRGSSYNANDPSNYTVNLDDIDTSFQGAGSVVIFQSVTGQIQNFLPASNSIFLTQVNINQTKQLSINKYGVIESIQ